MTAKQMKRLAFLLALCVVVSIALSSSGIAETAKTTGRAKKTKVDEAKQLIERQRGKYIRNERDIFMDIFVFVEMPPETFEITRSPDGPQPSLDPSASPSTVTKTERRKKEAQRDVQNLRPLLLKHMREHKYQEIVQKIEEFVGHYEDLGKEELDPIMKPLSEFYLTAEAKLASIRQFDEVCASLIIYAILWSDKHQSAIINESTFVRKGDKIAHLFGETAPKDLKISAINAKSIVISSEELRLSKEIVFNPTQAGRNEK